MRTFHSSAATAVGRLGSGSSVRRLLAISVGAVSALALAPAAQAAVFLPGSPNFVVSGNIASGPVSAFIGNSGITSGSFQDTFTFRINQNGVGSGSISTSTSAALSATDLDISSVVVNGLSAIKTFSTDGLSEFFNISDVPITFGAVNNIVVTGLSRGNGSYGGNATFIPSAVPEPATWGLMVLGFGLVGAGVRSRRRSHKLTFS